MTQDEKKIAEEAVPARIETETLKPIHGRIISGMQLSVASQKRIAACFEKRLGKPVKLTCRIDKREIGGVRVELDGYSYSGTVRGQLQDLQKFLLNAGEGGTKHE